MTYFASTGCCKSGTVAVAHMNLNNRHHGALRARRFSMLEFVVYGCVVGLWCSSGPCSAQQNSTVAFFYVWRPDWRL